ncbi:crossover junction endodeoxyribonuclease RuvC [Vagococcus zengguangii]|uniref:crossover junction endodeoxyribonuclease RuvC n=1 Tax=Vagococcus zengguangii TaxID=2571750 RepID=UPI00143CED65|nr:crossover junction endodeoxyribonuclease RuvC [Vagococcus zengguangii]
MVKNIVLALDLSLTETGYAICKIEKGNFEVLEFGTIKTSSKDSMGYRLQLIESELIRIMQKWHPDSVVKEKSFSNRNITSTQAIFQVVRIASYAIWKELELVPIDYAATNIKKTLTGNGRASKEHLMEKVKALTNSEPTNFDESDAIAVAYTYYLDKV